jgi:carboxypeptidase Q
MPRFRRFFSVFVVVASLVAAQAPPEIVASVARESETNSQVMAHLDHLANQIGPRLTGSERLTKACEWARDQFKSFGIENARLEQWGKIDVGFDRGVHAGFVNAGAESRPVMFGTNAWTPGTGGMKEGPAVLAPATDAGLPDLRAKAKGAWVVLPSGPPAPGASDRLPQEIEAVCVDEGALGLIRNGGQLIITGGRYRTKWNDLPKLVRINLYRDDYANVVESLGAGKKVRLGFDVQNRFKEGPVPVFNVLADIPGTEKPDEIVIVGGHIDSWDGATGTTDNGTGTATTLEAARLLMAAGAKPRRTIRFMLWSGEEEGLLGSVAWVRDHAAELDNISAVLVHDGGTNYVSGIQSTAAMLPAIQTAFEPVITMLGQKLEDSVEKTPEGRPARGESRRAPESRRAAEAVEPVVRGADESMKFKISLVAGLSPGSSDHDSFLARGVPGFFWRQAGRANYRYTHHTQYDTYGAAIPEYQKHSAKVIALGALGIANLDAKLSRENLVSATRGPGLRRLGVQFGGDGLKVDEVTPDGRGAAAGLKVGDQVVKVDDIAVKDATTFRDALRLGAPKKVITYVRDGKELQATVDFGESRGDSRPASRIAR